MFDFLISIPGPVFLAVYVGYSAVIIYLSIRFARNDYTRNMEIPEPTSINPVEISILKKGVRGAIITSMYNLWSKGHIELVRDSKGSIKVKSKHKEGHLDLSELEKTILDNTVTAKPYRFFFTNASIDIAKRKLEKSYTKLTEMNLIPDKKIILHNWFTFFVGALLLIALGGTKYYFGITYNKPSAFLMILMIVSIILLVVFAKPYRVYVSCLGRKFLRYTAKRFEWLKKEKITTHTIADDNLAYAVAVFGVAAFSTAQFSSLERAGHGSFFSYGGEINSGCGGSFGSGAGSGCSGGTGCSGGSGCGGGGCGGCGGGGS